MVALKLAKTQVLTTVLAVFCFIGCASFYLLRFDLFSQNLPSSTWLGGDTINDNATIFGSENPKQIEKRQQASVESPSRNDLLHILKKAASAPVEAIPNDTIIITTVNDAWSSPGSVMEHFFKSFASGERILHFLNRLVIVAVDPKAYARCKLTHLHCYQLETNGTDFSHEAFSTPEFFKLQWRKIDFLREVLEMGYSFVFTDLDVMWLRNPYPDLLGHPNADIVISSDYYHGNDLFDSRNVANTGFYYVKASNRTAAFHKYLYESRVRFPETHDYDVFHYVRNDSFVKEIGIKFSMLDPEYFGGLCKLQLLDSKRDFNKLRIVHANCCVGLQKKLHNLDLVLGGWANYTDLLPNDREKGGLDFVRFPEEDCG